MRKIAIISTCLLLILALRFFFFYQNQPQYTDGQEIIFETTLLSEPRVVGRYQHLSAKLASGERIFITIPQFPEFHYSDTIRISGMVKVLTSNGQERLLMSFPKVEKIQKGHNFVLAVSSWFRQKVIHLFSSGLPPTSASLLLGIVFGIKENMPKEFSDSLRTSGVMHVVAASGMNVTMVAGFLSSFFAFFLRRQIALLAAIAGIMFYALLAGLEPSIMRASIMGILVFLSQALGRQSLSLFFLTIAGFFMLFFSPPTLFDIGFQLSFAATLGLLYLKPFPTTIAAQIATLPILLSNFGSYSLWSILVNGLILWTIPILMTVGGIGSLVGIVSEPLAQLILYLSLPLLIYFEKIVTFFGQSGGMLSLTIPWQLGAAYYLFLLAILRKK